MVRQTTSWSFAIISKSRCVFLSEQISWVSIFGAITGFSGLALHFWRFLQERPAISIYQPTDDLGKMAIGYVLDGEYTDVFGVALPNPNKYEFWVWLRITNESEKPLTFLEFVLEIPDLEPLALTSKSIPENTANIEITKTSAGHSAMHSRKLTPTVKPVFTLEPYRADEGYFYFGPTNIFPNKEIEATLKVITTRKTFIQKIKIIPIKPLATVKNI